VHSFYLASLRLTCDRKSPELDKAFARRWSLVLERKWSKLTFKTSEPIEAKLNATIHKGCRTNMGKDLLQVPLGVDALEPGAWRAAPEGGFFQSATIRSRMMDGVRDWTFVDKNNHVGTISVYAKIERITY